MNAASTLEGFQAIADVPIIVSAELAQRKLSTQDLLALRVGSVVELSRPAGENINIYAGDILLGSAEVLVIESTLAIRIAELRDKETDAIEDQPREEL